MIIMCVYWNSNDNINNVYEEIMRNNDNDNIIINNINNNINKYNINNNEEIMKYV